MKLRIWLTSRTWKEKQGNVINSNISIKYVLVVKADSLSDKLNVQLSVIGQVYTGILPAVTGGAITPPHQLALATRKLCNHRQAL